jgi:glycosyltransferase involved in cell wall biosynthesis
VNAGARYRVHKYLPYLEAANIGYTVYGPMSNRLFTVLNQTRNPIKKILYYVISFALRLWQLPQVFLYDVIFIHQGLIYLGPPFLEKLIAMVRSKIIFDADDANFARPRYATGLGARLYDRERTAKLCKLASHVIVSVEFLRNYVVKYNPHVSIIPTSIDLEKYTPKDAQAVNPRVVIGWAGTAPGLTYLRDLGPVFRRLWESYDFELRIVSSESLELTGVDVGFRRWSLQNEIDDLREFDIGIMPLPDGPFEQGKGGFKLIQYMGVGLPVVCSPVGINAQIVVDGANGFLANSEEEWFEKLSALIHNPQLRTTVGRKGRESLTGRFTIEANAPKFIDIINAVAGRNPEK